MPEPTRTRGRGGNVEINAARLRAARHARNLTQRELATAAGLGDRGGIGTVCRLESGRAGCAFDTAAALAAPLGLSVRELIGPNPYGMGGDL